MVQVRPFSHHINTRHFRNSCHLQGHLHLGQESKSFAKTKTPCSPGMHWLLFLSDTKSICQRICWELQIGRKLKKPQTLHVNFAWLEMLTAIPGNLTALIKKKNEHNLCMGVFHWPPLPALLPFLWPKLHSSTPSTNYLVIKNSTSTTSCLLKDFLRLQSHALVQLNHSYVLKSKAKVVSKHSEGEKESRWVPSREISPSWEIPLLNVRLLGSFLNTLLHALIFEHLQRQDGWERS